MIVKFRKEKRGVPKNPLRAAKGATGYLLGNKDHKGHERGFQPVLLSGSPDEFEQIVGYGNHAGKYTSGGLYFEESRKDLVERFGSEIAVNKKLQEIMDGFEDTLFPGLDKDQYCGVWILHEDKGNIELNFLFAKEELRSGKGLTPYFHGADLKRVNAWKDIINFENGFSDPTLPDKKRSFTPEFFSEYKPVDKASPEHNRRHLKQALSEYLVQCVEDGLCKSRDGVIELLNKTEYKVSRITKKSISVINPETLKPVRLTGSIFEEGTDYKHFSSEDYRNELMKRYEEERIQKIKKKEEIYKEHMEYKKEMLMNKYNKEISNGTTHQRNDFKLCGESRSENDKARTREQASERRDIEREEAFRATSNSLREQAERRQDSSFKRFKRNVEQFRSTSNPFSRIIERAREINNTIMLRSKKKNLSKQKGLSL